MEINYQFRKNRFIFHFFLKIKPTILSSGRLIVIKNLLLPVEQIFRLVQIFFRNHVVIFPKLLPLKATFPSNFQLLLISGQWRLIFCLVETVSFCSELFLCCQKPIGGTNFRKHFPGTGNYFVWFSCQKKQNLSIVVTYFSTNASFRVVETDFLASSNIFYIFSRDTCHWKHFSRLRETYFWNNLSAWFSENDFFP